MKLNYYFFSEQKTTSEKKKKVLFNIADEFSPVCFDRTQIQIRKNPSLYEHSREENFVKVLLEKVQSLKNNEILCIDFTSLGALTTGYVNKTCRLILINRIISSEEIYEKVCFSVSPKYLPEIFEKDIKRIIEKLS